MPGFNLIGRTPLSIYLFVKDAFETADGFKKISVNLTCTQMNFYFPPLHPKPGHRMYSKARLDGQIYFTLL